MSIEAPNVAELPQQLADPVWRLTSGFYRIRSVKGEPIPFIPTPAQMQVILAIYREKHLILCITKSRQVYMSTLICLICLDTILFGANVQVTIVDKDVESAKKKMIEKIWYAWDRLPEPLKSTMWEEDARATHPHAVLRIRHLMAKSKDGVQPTSDIFAGDSPRGGTNQLLFYSEWAEVAATSPAKSREYLQGGWPSGEHGLRIIESTWSGGKTGEVWGLIERSLDRITTEPLPNEQIKEGMAKVIFLPWFVLPDRQIKGEASELEQDTVAYFENLEKHHNIHLTVPQKLWYQRNVLPLGHEGRSTYPSIIQECWDGIIEGAIWASSLSRARDQGNVGSFPHDPEYEVNTIWDLGAPENQPCLYVQHIGGKHRVVDLDDRLPDVLEERITRLKEKGYRYGTHYLPHDAYQRQRNGATFRDEFERELTRQGVTGRIVVLKRTQDKTLGINHATLMLRSQVQFHEETTSALLTAAASFRWKKDKSREGHFLDEPEKDWTSHLADTLIYLAEADLAEHLPTQSNQTMQNLYFDAPYIKELASRLPEHPEQRWAIEKAGTTFQHVQARPDPDYGWLRVWESPVPQLPYLVACTQGAIAVWRGPYRDARTEQEMPARLVAATVPEPSIQPSILYGWCALTAAHYGDVPVLLDITSLPGSVEELRGHGVAVMGRRQPMEERRLGQQSPEIRKPGHTWNPKDRLDALQNLQGLLRDRKAELWCSPSLNQLLSVILSDTGEPETLEGAKDHWLRCHALALQSIQYSYPARQTRGIYTEPTDYRRGPIQKKKMA